MELPPTSTIGALLQTLRDDTTRLLRQEVALARAEFGQTLSRLLLHAGALAAAVGIAFAGGLLLLLALADLVVHGLVLLDLGPDTALWVGRGIVGAAAALSGWVMFSKARRALAAESLLPTQTVASVQDNTKWAQTKLNPSHGTTH